MRIAISGTDRKSVIEKVEQKTNLTSVKAFDKYKDTLPLLDYAAVSYRYYSDKNVLFDGCVLDYVAECSDGYSDVQEQIVLSSIANFDKIFVVNTNLSDQSLSVYKDYMSFYPDKIVFINDENDVNITLD